MGPRSIAVALLAACLAACGGSSTSPSPAPTTPTASTTPAASAGVSTATTQSTSNLIEALFLRTGPDSVAANNGCSGDRGDRRVGFPTASTVTLTASTTLNSTQMAAVHQFADRLTDYTSGQLSARVVETSADTLPGTNETTIGIGDPATLGCSETVTGCAQQHWTSAGVFTSSRVVFRSGATTGLVVHELGHSVMGLCHVEPAVVGTTGSVMSPTVSVANFTDADLTATRAVFAVTDPGATRSQFVAAGLLSATQLASVRPRSTGVAGQDSIGD